MSLLSHARSMYMSLAILRTIAVRIIDPAWSLPTSRIMSYACYVLLLSLDILIRFSVRPRCQGVVYPCRSALGTWRDGGNMCLPCVNFSTWLFEQWTQKACSHTVIVSVTSLQS